MLQTRPSVTSFLIAINVVCFLLELSLGDDFILNFALMPIGAGFMPWQVLTHAFLHGGVTHLLFNMFGLWMFGKALEFELGSRAMAEIYFASILSAAMAQLCLTYVTDATYPTIGASGGVFGLLLAFGVVFPKRIIVLLIPPIPMPAWLFVTFYAVIELYLGVTGSAAGVAHFAHLGGMAGAYLVIRYRRRRR
ncbi:MAG TPA: rhomboid family intramembrane serine protease [Burkholderiaceae bacterium]